MAGLARAYYYGSGVEKDYAKAVEWNEKAMSLGSVEAQQLLAVQYANGQGVTRDRKRAVDLAHQAADKGSFSAMRLLSWLYSVGGDGVKIDSTASAKWLRRAIEQESANAR
jgi:TPR repeat protein